MIEGVSSYSDVWGVVGGSGKRRGSKAVSAGVLAAIMPMHCSARSKIEIEYIFQETSSWRIKLGRWLSFSTAVMHAL